MPPPTTTEEFLDVVRKSDVVDEERLTASLRRGSLPGAPAKLAAQLVRDGVLTPFQAEQFVQGKWRKFILGQYRVLERLASRSTGSVYLAEHAVMQRRLVAIKILPAAMALDPAALERFYRGARALAAMHHPNVVLAFDVAQADDLHFLVMEYVDGCSLKEIVQRGGPLEVLRAAHYVRQAAFGLHQVHELHIVHRHVKPSNVFLDRQGVVKFVDLSLAAFSREDDLTATASVIGTPDFLAPEQTTAGVWVDSRADVYSLGCTFYFCLTGRPPFAGGTVTEKLLRHQTRQPRPIGKLRPEVPAEIVAIVERMMARDVDARFQTAQEVIDALEPHTRTPIPPPPEDEMPRYCPALEERMRPSGG